MKTWIWGVALAGLAALIVGAIAFPIANRVSRSGRDKALDRLQARLAMPVGAEQPGKFAGQPATTADARDAGGPPNGELENLRTAASRLAAMVTDSASSSDRNGVWRSAHGILDALLYGSKTVQGLTEAELEVLEQYLAMDEDVWAALEVLDWRRIHEAALTPDAERTEMRGTWDTSQHAAFRHIAEAVLDARAGDGDAVFRDFTAFLRAGEVTIVWSEPVALLANMAIGFQGEGGVSREAEDELLAQLARNRRRETYCRHWKRVFALHLTFVNDWQHTLYNEAKLPPIGTWLRPVYCTAGAPLLNSDVQHFADNAQRILDASSLPHLKAEAAYQDVRKEFQVSSLAMALQRDLWLNQLCQPGAFTLRAKQEAWFDLTRLGITLERYRVEHGTYPETLDELRELFPEGMPEDPFSGESYTYSSDGESFRLSSVYKNDVRQDGKSEIVLQRVRTDSQSKTEAASPAG